MSRVDCIRYTCLPPSHGGVHVAVLELKFQNICRIQNFIVMLFNGSEMTVLSAVSLLPLKKHNINTVKRMGNILLFSYHLCFWKFKVHR